MLIVNYITRMKGLCHDCKWLYFITKESTLNSILKVHFKHITHSVRSYVVAGIFDKFLIISLSLDHIPAVTKTVTTLTVSALHFVQRK